MPYTDKQRKDHIRELQGLLHRISLFDNRIPRIYPGGLYDENTVRAVETFQRVYGLPVTGETDSVTWNLIAATYRDYLELEPDAYNVFPSRNFRAAVGDSGELIYIIQAMLMKAAGWYDNMPRVTVGGRFDEATARAVRRFQKLSGLPESGAVDSKTWNNLVKFLGQHRSRNT